MNLVPEIRLASPLAGAIELRYLVYLFLISEARSTAGVLYSKYRISDVKMRFTHFEESLVADAVKELLREKLIQSTPDGVIVGRRTGTTNNLFLPEDGSLQAYRTRISDLAERYVENAVRRGVARSLKSQQESLLLKPLESWGVNEYGQLYGLLYTFSYEETPRDFTQKERGQIGYLRKQFDPVTLFKMFTEYLLNSEKYAKDAPTLGLMLFHKDTLAARVKNLSKTVVTRKGMRTAATDESF